MGIMKSAKISVHTANPMTSTEAEKVLPSKTKFSNFTYSPPTTILNITLQPLLVYTTATCLFIPMMTGDWGCVYEKNVGSHSVHSVHTSKNNKLS